MLFKEIISLSTENHKEPIITLCGKNAELMIIKEVVYVSVSQTFGN
jgi:hypothetical protein